MSALARHAATLEADLADGVGGEHLEALLHPQARVVGVDEERRQPGLASLLEVFAKTT